MVLGFLMRMMAEAVFDATTSRTRSYEAEFERYLAARGFVVDPKHETSTR